MIKRFVSKRFIYKIYIQHTRAFQMISSELTNVDNKNNI